MDLDRKDSHDAKQRVESSKLEIQAGWLAPSMRRIGGWKVALEYTWSTLVFGNEKGMIPAWRFDEDGCTKKNGHIDVG